MGLQPSQLHIGALISGKQFKTVEIVQSPDLATMKLDLLQRYEQGQRWGFALLHQQVPGQPYPVYKRGIVFLRYVEREDIYRGVYYPLADCGEDNAAARATAFMLSILYPASTEDEFFYGHLLDSKKLYFTGLCTPDLSVEYLA